MSKHAQKHGRDLGQQQKSEGQDHDPPEKLVAGLTPDFINLGFVHGIIS